jgi:hypothetical protein
MALPDSYSDLYPNRFLHADQLQGKKITLTIASMNIEVLEGEKKKAAKVVATFAKPQSALLAKLPLDLVIPKTNGECLRRMFGNNPNAWVGKRVTLYPSKTPFGNEIVDCIRIWGSPDIDADMDITVPQGRRRPIEMTMHKVEVKNGASAKPEPTIPVDPNIMAAFGILGWTPKEQSEFLTENAKLAPAEMLAKLNATIDAQDAVEVQ